MQSNRTILNTTSIRRLACLQRRQFPLLALICDFLCHTKAMERCVKANTEASSKVCGSSARDGNVRARIVNMTSFETKADYKPADNISITYDKHKPSGEEIEIYTDGSKINDQVGAAIVVFYYNTEIFNRTIRLSDFATVYQAEVTGIQLALEFISTIGPWNKINLYTDSLSVLEALNTFKTSKQEILAIKNDILEMSKEKSITLHWIPAHTGIQGNETADSYAKKATTRPNIEKIPKKSFKQLKNAISNVQIQIWHERWALSTTKNGKHTEKLIPAVSIHTKKFSHFIVQFLSGHGRFPAYFVRFGRSLNIKCPCGAVGDTLHYVVNFPFTEKYEVTLCQCVQCVGKLSGIMVRLADRFTALYRKYQTNSCTGPENASNSPLAMGPSLAASKDSVSILQSTADEGK
ncbi:hypothetical protein AVEN_153924-1 [Araneus ventricosus]|uniref:RNase H type-1 domain-containing protein n=1 Tax=Araneus ventricosus TaxID=182803 RepID=A0A4Y2F8H6_ARAVE|nr:hypothetical protein AVEN_153924-1 [Araneus ventricosus]